MYKDLLSKEELAALLSPSAEQETGKNEERSSDHRDLALHYLHEIVLQLQMEIVQLRKRIETLEGHPTPAAEQKTAAGANKEGDPPDARHIKPDSAPNIALSRSERHRSQRGKWF